MKNIKRRVGKIAELAILSSVAAVFVGVQYIAQLDTDSSANIIVPNSGWGVLQIPNVLILKWGGWIAFLVVVIGKLRSTPPAVYATALFIAILVHTSLAFYAGGAGQLADWVSGLFLYAFVYAFSAGFCVLIWWIAATIAARIDASRR